MKRSLCLLTLICILFTLLAGCGKDLPETGTVPTTELPSTVIPSGDPAATAPVIREVPDIPAQDQIVSGSPKTLEDWVFTNYEETFSWLAYPGEENTFTISLPAITPVADFAVEYNEMVRELAAPILEDLKTAMDDATNISFTSVTYEANMLDDIISIVLIQQTDVDYTYYTVFSFDTEDREVLTTAELCEELLDVNYPTFLLAGNGYIDRQFRSTLSKITISETDKPYYDQLLKSIAYMGAAGRQLYVGSDGQVMMLYPAPSVAGASYYPTVIPFDLSMAVWDKMPTEEEAYQQLFDLLAEADGAYTGALEVIYADAFEAESDDFAEALSLRGTSDIETIASLVVRGFADDLARLETLARDLDEASVREAILSAAGLN